MTTFSELTNVLSFAIESTLNMRTLIRKSNTFTPQLGSFKGTEANAGETI